MIKKVISYFGIDGLSHIVLSSLALVILKLFLPLWIAITVVVICCIGKEIIYDKFLKKGQLEKKDFIADTIGIIIGLL